MFTWAKALLLLATIIDKIITYATTQSYISQGEQKAIAVILANQQKMIDEIDKARTDVTADVNSGKLQSDKYNRD